MRENETFYNEDIKKSFIGTFSNKSTRLIVTYPLREAYKTESELKKDLFEMTLSEIGYVLSDLACSTENAVYNNLLKIEEYILWATKNGYRKTNINPLQGIDKVEWSRQFVSSYKRTSFTKIDILNMLEDLANNNDKAVLLCLFEGIGGTGFSEILNLRIKDIVQGDRANYVTLYDVDKDGNKEDRTITISDLLLELLIKTDEQTYYENSNGDSQGDRYSTSELIPSPFVFKKARRGTSEGGLDSFFISRKFNMYKKIFDLKHMKAQHVVNSGIMHMSNEYYIEHGVFTSTHAHEVAEHYNTSWTYAGGGKYRNATIIKKIVDSQEFVNLYGYSIVNEETWKMKS